MNLTFLLNLTTVWILARESAGRWRWSNGISATILFRTGTETRATPGPLVLEIVAGTFQAQRLTVFINDVEVGTIDRRTDWEPTT